MSTEDVKSLQDELREKVCRVLWEFTDKHCNEVTAEVQYQVATIMQSVLVGCVSDLEYQMGRPVRFTRHQEDHICYQIGEWYFLMKPLLEGSHNLGHMKEKLKSMICGEGND